MPPFFHRYSASALLYFLINRVNKASIVSKNDGTNFCEQQIVVVEASFKKFAALFDTKPLSMMFKVAILRQKFQNTLFYANKNEVFRIQEEYKKYATKHNLLVFLSSMPVYMCM